MSAINEPLVSVIIPTYRNRGGLKRAIDSVSTQTYKNLEIIVVDDNNPEDKWRRETETLIQSLSDDRIKYIKHSVNKNGAAARNTGILNSSGNFIAFLDDDDYFLPDKISKQVYFLINDVHYDAVYCQGIKNGHIIATNLKQGNLSTDILLLRSYMFTPSLMFRRSVFNRLTGFDESFVRHQDYELLLRFFKQEYKIGVIQEPLFGIGENQGENTLSSKQIEGLKEYFFSKFDKYIRDFNKSNKRFQSKVYACHYSNVFLKYLKDRDLKNALRIFNMYFWRNPISFFKPIMKSLYAHLSMIKL